MEFLIFLEWMDTNLVVLKFWVDSLVNYKLLVSFSIIMLEY